MARILSKPQVDINGIVIFIVPNSLKVMYGFGTKSLKAQSGGGDSTNIVTSHNVEERVGQITFEVFSEEENVQRVLDLMDSNDNIDLDVSFSEPNVNISGTMKDASIVNDPEHGYSADGKLELQIHGGKIKRG